MKCRKLRDDVETGGWSLTRNKSGGCPDFGPDGIRHEGGVTLNRALARNVGTCRPDAKGAIQVGGLFSQKFAAGPRDRCGVVGRDGLYLELAAGKLQCGRPAGCEIPVPAPLAAAHRADKDLVIGNHHPE